MTLDLDRAVALCEECMRRCEATGEQWARSTALWVRGAARWMSGDNDRAIEDALDGLRVKERARRPAHDADVHRPDRGVPGRARCALRRCPAGGSADFARAAVLCGAGDALWRVLNAPVLMGPTYAEIRKDAAAKCRSALGEERFEAAYRHGMAMSLAEAIALARDEAAGRGHPAPGR